MIELTPALVQKKRRQVFAFKGQNQRIKENFYVMVLKFAKS